MFAVIERNHLRTTGSPSRRPDGGNSGCRSVGCWIASPRLPEEAELAHAADANRSSLGEEIYTDAYGGGGGMTPRGGKVAGDLSPNRPEDRRD
jgi:hypothetical protein